MRICGDKDKDKDYDKPIEERMKRERVFREGEVEGK